MFGQPSEQARHKAIKVVMNSKMKANVSVREHVLKMINYIHEVEINGAIIDEGTQVGMILETLSSRFMQFKSNYFMNRLKYNLTELLNELQTFESISKEKEPESNVAEVYHSTTYKNNKGKNKDKNIKFIKGSKGSKNKSNKKNKSSKKEPK
ncbi:hypothetical protein MA16_Dca020639 [Dendrobium catenatum]|uniref:Retrovirus-related Pol polyprotein from transposon TNT 1-94 n=1 Tax=Dendrobium catenatum TaxID=906689 RepID=A0A2I0WP76_9ASPA|nr:hypothetical protein MA16_Dca020639 [Dendrobium catenatum]